MTKSFEDIVGMVPEFPDYPPGKYAPKLEFAQRCEILAWRQRGVPKSVLAKIFNLHPRTIKQITSPDSKTYKNVRSESEKLGELEFQRKYITETTADRIYRSMNATTTSANNAKSGIHIVETAEGPRRIFIDFRGDGEQGPGWYYQDLDGSDPTGWYHCGEESRTHSAKLLEMVKQELA